MSSQIIVAIAGGFAAGKRTLCKKINDQLGNVGKSCEIVSFHEFGHKNLQNRNNDLILVHGLTPFLQRDDKRCFDFKIFLDVEADIRLGRMVLQNRHSDLTKYIENYLKEIRPFHSKFVLKQKPFADFYLAADYSPAHIKEIINCIEETQRNEGKSRRNSVQF